MLDRSSKCLLLEDRFDGTGQHLFELFFHFFPGVEVEQVSEHAFRATASGSTILLKFSANAGWNARLEEGWVSEGYGQRRRAAKIVLASRQTAPATVSTSIHFDPSPDQEGSGTDMARQRTAVLRRYAEVTR